MLETLLARYLGKFLKDFTAEHISAHLLKGSVKLKDVELDLTTLEQEFFAKVPKPAALELQSVRCASIGLKVPWKRLRRKPVIFELSGLEVKVSVHSPENVEGKVQEKLNRHVDSQEEMNIEEAEDVEDGKVESQLKVGLKEVILDGLQIMLNTLQVDLAAQDGETAASRPLLRLSLEALETFPCSVRGEKINRPQDVYEFCDPCARLFRSVQIDGLKLITLDHQPGALVEVIGQVGIQLEQRRWCGFIPHHRARRVCPFSSETAIALRVPSVAMQLQVEPIMAVCEVLLHLIKGGMTYSELNESDSSPTAEVESAITWSTPQAGGAGAAGSNGSLSQSW